MANWSLLTTTLNYLLHPSQLLGMLTDVATGFNGTGSNLPDDTLRFNRSTGHLQSYDATGGTWSDEGIDAETVGGESPSAFADASHTHAHNVTTSRDASDCHPQGAITGLTTALAGKITKAGDSGLGSQSFGGGWTAPTSVGGVAVRADGVNNTVVAKDRVAAGNSGWAVLRIWTRADLPALFVVGDISQAQSYIKIADSAGTELFDLSAGGVLTIPGGLIGTASNATNFNGLPADYFAKAADSALHGASRYASAAVSLTNNTETDVGSAVNTSLYDTNSVWSSGNNRFEVPEDFNYAKVTLRLSHAAMASLSVHPVSAAIQTNASIGGGGYIAQYGSRLVANVASCLVVCTGWIPVTAGVYFIAKAYQNSGSTTNCTVEEFSIELRI